MQNLYLLIGPSGSGKTSVAEFLRTKGMRVVDSYTTRPKRYPEETGHTFITNEEFDSLKNIVAYTEYGGNRYCVTKSMLDQSDIYVIDPKGVKNLEKNYEGKKIVKFWLSAFESVCKERMRQRGDNEESIRDRLELDADEFSFRVHKDLMVDSGDIYDLTIYANGPLKEVCRTVLENIALTELMEYGLE